MIRKSLSLLIRIPADVLRPDVLAQIEAQDNTIYPHNAYVVSCFHLTPSNPLILISIQNDELKSYIDWAISSGFGVVDINFPQSDSKDDAVAANELDSYVPKQSSTSLENQTKVLLCYVWDNWLETNIASVTLMGVGDAYIGIKQLLTSRGMLSSFSYPSKVPSFWFWMQN